MESYVVKGYIESKFNSSNMDNPDVKTSITALDSWEALKTAHIKWFSRKPKFEEPYPRPHGKTGMFFKCEGMVFHVTPVTSTVPSMVPYRK